MKIAITGATGHLGRIVVSKLKERVAAADIVALVRSRAKAADLGVEAREANYDDVQKLEEVLQGVDVLLLISGTDIGKRAQQHQHVIAAAKKNGVKRIVYTSILKADTSTISLAPEHLATEEALKQSGVPFTILRNAWYTENYAGAVQGAVASGVVPGSAGEGKISAASRKDYAEAAAVVLTTDGHEGKVYELGGDEPFTLSDLAAEISRQSGKDVSYKHMPVADYAALLVSFGVPQDMANMIAGWEPGIEKGDLYTDDKQLSHLIGRPAAPISEMVAEVLKQAS